MEKFYSSWCYINTKQKRVDFKPEKKLDELEYQHRLWSRSFPKKAGAIMENLRLSNVGRYSVCKLNVSENLVKMIPKIYGVIERKKKAMKDLIVTESNGGLWV
jgi:hypothetical protein